MPCTSHDKSNADGVNSYLPQNTVHQRNEIVLSHNLIVDYASGKSPESNRAFMNSCYTEMYNSMVIRDKRKL